MNRAVFAAWSRWGYAPVAAWPPLLAEAMTAAVAAAASLPAGERQSPEGGSAASTAAARARRASSLASASAVPPGSGSAVAGTIAEESALLAPLPPRPPRSGATADDLDELSALHAAQSTSTSVGNRLYGMPDAAFRRLRCAGPPDAFRGRSLGVWRPEAPDAPPAPLPNSSLTVLRWSWLVEWTSARAAPPASPFPWMSPQQSSAGALGGGGGGGAASPSPSSLAAEYTPLGLGPAPPVCTQPAAFFVGFCEQDASAVHAVTRTGLYWDGRLAAGEPVAADETAALREAYAAVCDLASVKPPQPPPNSLALVDRESSFGSASGSGSSTGGSAGAAGAQPYGMTSQGEQLAKAAAKAAAMLRRATRRWDVDGAAEATAREWCHGGGSAGSAAADAALSAAGGGSARRLALAASLSSSNLLPAGTSGAAGAFGYPATASAALSGSSGSSAASSTASPALASLLHDPAQESRILPPLADGDVISFVYRAAESAVEAYVNGCKVATLPSSPTCWAYPVAAVFSGFVRLRLLSYEALVHMDEGK